MATKTKHNDKLFSYEEAAAFLAVSPTQVKWLVRAGRLPAVNVSAGGKRPRYRISNRDLLAFIEAHRVIRPWLAQQRRAA